MKKDIFRVFTTNLLKMLVTILTAFVIPKFLPVDQYGNLKLYQFYASYAGVTHLGFCDGLYLKLGGKKIGDIDKKKLSDTFFTLLGYELLIGGILLLFGIISQNFNIVCLGIMVAPCVLSTMCNYVFQATGEFKCYTKVINVSTVCSLFLYVGLLLFRVVDYRAYVFGECMLQFVLIFVNCRVLVKAGKLGLGKPEFSVFKDMVKTGCLLLLGNFAYSLFLGIDKWFINFSMEIEDFSNYSFAGQMVTIVNMFVSPVALTLYSNMAQRRDQGFELKIEKIILTCLMFVPAGIYAIDIVVRTFISQYISALNVVSVLLISQIFLCLNTAVFVNLYKTYQWQKEYFMRLLISLAAAFILDAIVLLWKPSIFGYAIATLLSSVIWLALNMGFFKYMRFTWREFLYAGILLACYVIAMKGDFVFRIVVYSLVYLVATRFLMPDAWQTFISEIKECGVKIKKRNRHSAK